MTGLYVGFVLYIMAYAGTGAQLNSSSTLAHWLPVAFQKCLMAPLRACDEATQQNFMEVAGGMSDDQLDFK